MSSHPGSGLNEAIELAQYCKELGFNPEQVQDFYPTPGSLATVMYYTGVDPRTMEPVYVAKSPHEKALQRALIQFRDPKNHDLVREALHKAHREDLIGFGPGCLVRPRRTKGSGSGRAAVKSTQKEREHGAGKLAMNQGERKAASKKELSGKGQSKTHERNRKSRSR